MALVQIKDYSRIQNRLEDYKEVILVESGSVCSAILFPQMLPYLLRRPAKAQVVVYNVLPPLFRNLLL